MLLVLLFFIVILVIWKTNLNIPDSLFRWKDKIINLNLNDNFFYLKY